MPVHLVPYGNTGYFFYLEDEQKVFFALRAIFLEKEFLGEGTVASKIELGEVQPVKEPARSKDIIELAVIESHLEPSLRRSDKVPHQPDRYYVSWSRMVIPLSSMRTMRIRSPIWMYFRDLTLRHGLDPCDPR